VPVFPNWRCRSPGLMSDQPFGGSRAGLRSCDLRVGPRHGAERPFAGGGRAFLAFDGAPNRITDKGLVEFDKFELVA